MKILISFIPTVFPKYNHGGSTKILKDLAFYLGESGDLVTIICNRRKDNYKEFKLHQNVVVKPIYRFRETVPDPYFTPPYNLATSIQEVYEESIKNDLIFIFDSNFIFTDIFSKNIPIVFSLRDFLYSQALQGAYLFRRGHIIVNSEFVRDGLYSTVGRFYPEIKKNTSLIHNGVDIDFFKRKRPSKIFDYVKIPPSTPSS